ncbi:MAG: hypothetical protein ACFCU1_14505 [Sumerlaeia bacterium]
MPPQKNDSTKPETTIPEPMDFDHHQLETIQNEEQRLSKEHLQTT